MGIFQQPPSRRRPRGKHHRLRPIRNRKSPRSWVKWFSALFIQIVVAGFIYALLFGAHLVAVLTLLLLLTIFLVQWLLRTPAQPNRVRHHHIEQPIQQPVDEMTKHLARGETPIFGEDGEITFKKVPQQTNQSSK